MLKIPGQAAGFFRRTFTQVVASLVE